MNADVFSKWPIFWMLLCEFPVSYTCVLYWAFGTLQYILRQRYKCRRNTTVLLHTSTPYDCCEPMELPAIKQDRKRGERKGRLGERTCYFETYSYKVHYLSISYFSMHFFGFITSCLEFVIRGVQLNCNEILEIHACLQNAKREENERIAWLHLNIRHFLRALMHYNREFHPYIFYTWALRSKNNSWVVLFSTFF